MQRGIRESRGGFRRRGACKYPYFAPFERDRETTAGKAAERRNGVVKSPDFRGSCRAGVKAQDGRAIGDVEGVSVGREVFGRFELPDRLGRFQYLVGF